MPPHLRMFGLAGDYGPLGLHPCVKNGWAATYSTRPFGAADNPSLDETIGAGWGFVSTWGYGKFLPHEAPHPIGLYHTTQRPVTCEPRGPGAFGHPDFPDRDGYLSETRLRTDVCRKLNVDAGLYLGGCRMDAFSPTTAKSIVARTLDAWTAPIVKAGFTRVQFDAAAATWQSYMQPTPTMRLAEHLIYMGIEVDVENVELCTPSAFPWFDGRFGIVETPATRDPTTGRAGPGWFNWHCTGCSTRRFLMLQGSIPPAERKAMMEAEQEASCIVEPAGWWPMSERDAGSCERAAPPRKDGV